MGHLEKDLEYDDLPSGRSSGRLQQPFFFPFLPLWPTSFSFLENKRTEFFHKNVLGRLCRLPLKENDNTKKANCYHQEILAMLQTWHDVSKEEKVSYQRI